MATTYGQPVIIYPTRTTIPLLRNPGRRWALPIIDPDDADDRPRFLSYTPSDPESDWSEVTPGGWCVVESPDWQHTPTDVIDASLPFLDI